MKKVIIILGLFIYYIACFSQESGILKDTLNKHTSIYLSKIKIVSNKDYPVSMKDKISELKNKINKNDAEKNLLNSFVSDDNSFDNILYIDNGLGINLVITYTEQHTNGPRGLETVTIKSWTEKHPVFVPFSEIRFVRIRKNKDYCTIQFITKTTLGKGPYLGANKFIFKIKPEVDEVALIASVLYFCNNIRDSGFINY